MKKLIYVLAASLLIISACSKDYDKIDKEKIDDYVKSKGYTTQSTASGVQYIIEKDGSGDLLKLDDEIAVKYTGYFLDDKIFDKGDSAIFYLTDVIKGWQDALQNFKVGSKGKIFIPSELAYGKNGASNIIPAHAVVAFDVEILKKGPVVQKNKEDIRKYIQSKGWKADSLASGLYYVVDEPGTGSNPSSSQVVTVKYKGYTLDGKVFDQSDAGLTIGLGNVIEGWKQGIPLFKKGGKGKLLIPSRLAYYSSGAGSSIPPYAPLIFEIELVSF